MRISVPTRVMAGAIAACVIGAAPAQAQLNTQHLKGTVGLKAGSQPPPHTYIIAPLFYRYATDEVKDRDGGVIEGPNLSSMAFAGGINMVTTKKVLGGFYGFQVLFPVGANNRLQGTEIDADPGAGLTDSVFSPAQLGWHFKRADAVAGYTMFVPTGRYNDGATDNTGLGMWGHELSIGTTVYLTKTRQYHAATLASFDFQSKKQDSNTKVGNAMNLEGGIGGDFRQGKITAGLNYYASFKLTADQFDGPLLQLLIPGKDKKFALGPEVSVTLEHGGVIYGNVKFNYQWETYARTTTQGSEMTILATWLLKPLHLPTQ